MNLDETAQRIRWGVLAFLVGTAVLLTILDSTGNLDTALAVLRDPLAAVTAWTSRRADAVEDLTAGPRDLQTARQRIAELEAQVAEQERTIQELREDQGEAQLLFDLFNRARQSPEYRRITAAVIGLDTNPAIRSIIIDKGSGDGILVGMPVEGAQGLVGRVFRTANNSSQVILITDSASAVPARLGASRAAGILRGGGLGGSMVIEWLDLQYQVAIGEVVSTSGLGGEFPQDLVIGEVIDVERREAELFQSAVVQPAVDFEALEIVFVITDFQPIETDLFSDSPAPP